MSGNMSRRLCQWICVLHTIFFILCVVGTQPNTATSDISKSEEVTEDHNFDLEETSPLEPEQSESERETGIKHASQTESKDKNVRQKDPRSRAPSDSHALPVSAARKENSIQKMPGEGNKPPLKELPATHAKTGADKTQQQTLAAEAQPPTSDTQSTHTLASDRHSPVDNQLHQQPATGQQSSEKITDNKNSPEIPAPEGQLLPPETEKKSSRPSTNPKQPDHQTAAENLSPPSTEQRPPPQSETNDAVKGNGGQFKDDSLLDQILQLEQKVRLAQKSKLTTADVKPVEDIESQIPAQEGQSLPETDKRASRPSTNPKQPDHQTAAENLSPPPTEQRSPPQSETNDAAKGNGGQFKDDSLLDQILLLEQKVRLAQKSKLTAADVKQVEDIERQMKVKMSKVGQTAGTSNKERHKRLKKKVDWSADVKQVEDIERQMKVKMSKVGQTAGTSNKEQHKLLKKKVDWSDEDFDLDNSEDWLDYEHEDEEEDDDDENWEHLEPDVLDYSGKSKDVKTNKKYSNIQHTHPPKTDIQPSRTAVKENSRVSSNLESSEGFLAQENMMSTDSKEVTMAASSLASTAVHTPSISTGQSIDQNAKDSASSTAKINMEKSSSPDTVVSRPNIEPSEHVDEATHSATSDVQHETQPSYQRLSAQSTQTETLKLAETDAPDLKERDVLQTTPSKISPTQTEIEKASLSSTATQPGPQDVSTPIDKSQVDETGKAGDGMGMSKATGDQSPHALATSEGGVEDTTTPDTSPAEPEPPAETAEEREQKKQAEAYFQLGEKLVNHTYTKDYIQAYEYFKLAGALGHTKALEYLGFGYLLGDYVNQDTKKALEIFQELANRGSPRGQLGLGFMYSSGLAVDSSQAKSLIYFTFAALGGDSLAQMVLGYRYFSGIGVESKCETALQYYRKVASTVAEKTSAGSPVVQRVRIQEQVENANGGSSLMDEDLLQYHQFLADKGDVQAQVVLGQLYYQGARGVPINHERAYHYFTMAAESNNANAQAFLGKMHSEGSPMVKQDNSTAFKFFKQAADKGNPIGQSGLGTMYLHGSGVEQDYSKALRYFTLASDQGWVDGQLQLGVMHFSGKGVRHDLKLAVKYFNLASQGGHVLAFYYLAQMHATGTGVIRNCHTAVELYKNVAERGSWAGQLMEAHRLYKEGSVDQALLKYTFLAELGYEVAQSNVAYLLDQGETGMFSEQETYQRALLHWTRAASQGSTTARLKMGDYHYYGYGTEIDYETAASHYRLATEQQHNAQAMFNLGYMHENGLGLKQDIHLAKRFYDMAAETSGDAYVPVTLALVKLALFYGVDVFNKELEGYQNLLTKIDIRYQLGPNWDMFLATFLAIVLGIVVVLRRVR